MSWPTVMMGGVPLEHRVTSDKTNYNLFTDMGSPAGVLTVTVIVESGVKIKSSSSSNPSFDTGNFTAGSKIILDNNGKIYGAGGAAGNGGTLNGTCTVTIAPTAGTKGGNAVNARVDMDIKNADGEIRGGGGGGGGGGFDCVGFTNSESIGSGGGGGGRGNSGGSGGSGGFGTICNGFNGGAGSESGAGSGASGCSTFGGSGKRGGDGGSWAQAGSAGTTGDTAGASGGAAGKAIESNGNSISIIETGIISGATS